MSNYLTNAQLEEQHELIQHQTQEIWRIVYQLVVRGEKVDKNTIWREAESRNLYPGSAWMLPLLPDTKTKGSFQFTPTHVCAYIYDCLKDTLPKSIFDPAAQFGLMLRFLTELLRTETAIGVVWDRYQSSITQAMHSEASIVWKLADAPEFLDKIDQQFDLIVSALPLLKTSKSTLILSGGKAIHVADDQGCIFLLKSLQHLASSGTAFFITSPRFLASRDENTVRQNLETFGFYIHQAILLPNGTFPDSSATEGLLMCIRRSKPSRLFIGELTSDPTRSTILQKNFQSGQSGQVFQLGHWVDEDTFISFNNIIKSQDTERLARKTGLAAIPLPDVALKVFTSKEGFIETHHHNAVFLPTVGLSFACTSLNELQVDRSDHLRIVLNGEKALSAYVAQFYNTPLGHAIREAAFVGLGPKITKESLLSTNLYLPNIDLQAAAVCVNSDIEDIVSHLDALRQQLWLQPKQVQKTSKAINAIRHQATLPNWIDILPFPLASILWSYHAESDAEHKVDHLLHFFEALAQFLVTILFSVIQQEESWRREVVEEKRAGNKERDYFSRASFGTWTVFGARLAAFMRQKLDNQSSRVTALALFANPDHEFLLMITNKRLFSLLDEMKEYRNQWKGHGGVVSGEEAIRRLSLLEEHLGRTQQIIADHFSTTSLVRPQRSEYRDGLFLYSVSLLSGARTPFPEAQVTTLLPMDSGKLYLLNQGQLKPIELLPFVRIMESPRTQQNACYFFNRVDGEKIRWVSYHFTTEAEIIRPDVEAFDMLGRLKPSYIAE